MGGREKIVVTDDGCGMCPEDVLSCIQRHTTSKLSSIEDLSNISSRGFRGEALASMVSVAKVTITSAEHKGADAVCPGTVLVVAGGEILSTQETSAIPGTTVCVESLFYNVPARRKFLKSPAKDAQDIVKAMTMLAFSAPHVSFRLILDGELCLSVEGLPDTSNYIQRAKQLFGELFSKNSREVEYRDQHFSIKGVIASLQNTRSNRSLQYLLINGRPVVSPIISYIVKAACGTAIEQNRHPIFALCIDMDQSMLDINAHPQKREVRFADEESVKSAVYQAVLQALFSVQNFNIAPETQTFSDQFVSTPFSSFPTSPMKMPERDASVEISEISLIDKEPVCLAIIGDVALIYPNKLTNRDLNSDRSLGVSEQKMASTCDTDPFLINKSQRASLEPKPDSSTCCGTQPMAEACGNDEAIIALDLRATMRALLYKQACEADKETSSQTLLIPVTLQASSSEQALLNQAMPQLQELGFSLRPFGQNSYLIETVPTHLTGIDVEAFILDALHNGILTAHDVHVNERFRTLAHLQVAAMRDLKSPISRDFAIAVFKSWQSQGMFKTAPDGSYCYASITPKFLKASIAKGNLFVCQN